MVNVSSLLGVVALPYGSSYTMAKFAVRGLGGSLRQELRMSGALWGAGVHGSPRPGRHPDLRQRGQLPSGRRASALPPVYSAPERVARIIVNLIRVPRPEVIAGGLLGGASTCQPRCFRRSPSASWPKEADRLCLSRADTAPDGPGNLYRPAAGPGRVSGGWQGRRRERWRRVFTAGVATAGVAALVGRYRRS